MPRKVGSVVYVIRDEQLIESPSVVVGQMHRFGFMDISAARVAVLPFLDLTRKGTRDDLHYHGVVVRGGCMTCDRYVTTRTADVLAAIGPEPTTSRDVCAKLNRTANAVSGHLTSLIRQGKIERVERGVYRRVG